MNREMEIAMEVSGVGLTEMLSKSHRLDYVRARMLYSKLRADKGISISQIGRELNRNHSTVTYYQKMLRQAAIFDPLAKELIDKAEVYVKETGII